MSRRKPPRPGLPCEDRESVKPVPQTAVTVADLPGETRERVRVLQALEEIERLINCGETGDALGLLQSTRLAVAQGPQVGAAVEDDDVAMQVVPEGDEPQAKSLLPCPHCGSGDLIIPVDAGEGRTYSVQCDGCGALGGPSVESRREAVISWNKRAGEVGETGSAHTIVDQIEEVAGCQIGVARDALDEYLQSEGDQASATLQLVLARLFDGVNGIERLCVDAREALS